MVDDVDNDQFADELFECLFAYENEKWFLCSSSLGPLIEELMYLTLKNYNNHELDKN
ncbi:MAG: hypothetical protein O7C56_03265 [Rickettsia endosymbiont of Ixodes persulcatus]|nr:hypothetical protein [Rickettsia endosymbiont of Ixodes persulcatus]